MNVQRPAGAAALSCAGLLFLVAGSCDDDVSAPDPASGTVRILLDHEVSGEALVENQMMYATAEGNEFSVKKLRYVVSDIELAGIQARGDAGTTDDVVTGLVHLRDAFDDGSRVVTIPDVPEGSYTAVRLTFGLDENDNRTGANYTAPGFEDQWEDMRWLPSWGGGYHYMKLEGDFRTDTDAIEGFATHTGRRHAMSDPTFGTDPAPIPHSFEVNALAAFTVTDGDVWEIQLVMDVNGWYETPNLFDLDEFPRMIMMNTPVQDMLEANGADVYTAGTITKLP